MNNALSQRDAKRVIRGSHVLSFVYLRFTCDPAPLTYHGKELSKQPRIHRRLKISRTDHWKRDQWFWDSFEVLSVTT